ncbi:transcriptional regulator, SARP family [Actinokineospora spheciospongiae]|uniref:Transcriptional regulator, SARP family n=1 Tax=Actinokineospora spheciospongiae TaxID=909613 RepID=W7IWZ7_9PSEU|nr:BTAD domain-containing putative transcriptional regulator [Actinokineospora spheciospongiae]EWC61337.1 transcriptional regulator, SARP family [Actinokineospora spheciospongiae]
MLIRLIGLVSVTGDDGQPRHMSSAQAQVAFARLIMERAGGTERDQLADTVWPEGLPDTWASALRSLMSRVRAFMAGTVGPTETGEPPLVAQGRRYVLKLPDTAEVDVELAERAVGEAVRALGDGAHTEARRLAQSALEHLREPFLPHHEGEWVQGVRDHVDGLLQTALQAASTAAAAERDDREAVRLAEEAVRRSPLSEGAHRCLMTAHSTGGDRAEALRAYQRLRQVLADELGIDPSPETQSAYVELLGVRVGRDRARSAPGAAVPFSGRRGELAALAESWSRAEDGDCHLALVTGEPGVGKTRLATEAAGRIGRDGGLVVYGRCQPGAATAFQPITQALAEYVAATPPDSLPVLPPGPRETLAALAADPGFGARRGEAVTALADLLGALGQESLCLVVDDLDLADEGTFAVLRRVALNRAAGAAEATNGSVLLLATAGSRAAGRADARVGAAFAEFVQEADRYGKLRRVPLAGLDESDVRALSRKLVPTAAGADVPPPYRLIADTAGNAYLTVELLRWYQEGPAEPGRRLPSGVHDYAEACLAALEPGPRRFLRAAAVAGFAFELDLAADAAGHDQDEAMDALDVLVELGLVAEVIATGYGSRPVTKYRYKHDVVRRAVYEQLSETRRRWLHARFADAIERRRTGDLGLQSRALAHHRAASAEADGDTRTVQASWHAAAWAGRQGSPNEAVRLFEQALAHVPAADNELHADALTRLGLAQLAAGHRDCDQTLLDGFIQALHWHRLTIAAQAALGLADAVRTRPRLRPEAAALIDLLLRTLSRGEGPSVGGTVDDVTVGRLLARQCDLTRVTADPSVTRALHAMTGELRLLEGPDHLTWRATLAAEALTVAEAVGDTGARVVAAHHRAATADLTGDLTGRDTALAALAAAIADSDDDGEDLLAEHAVALAVTQGRLTDAAATARQLAPGGLAQRQMLIARWLVNGGRVDEATTTPGSAERALAAILRGDRGAAHLTVRALAIGAEALPTGDEWPHMVGVLALCAVELGDPNTAEAVRALLTPHTDLTCGVGYRSFVGTSSFHLGRLAVVIGEWDEAERHLSSALSQLSARRARPWMAVAQHALAQALENRNQIGDRRCAEALRTEASWTLASLGVRRYA